MSKREFNQTAKELKAARDLIADGRHWTQGTMEEGILWKKYCAVGAMLRVGASANAHMYLCEAAKAWTRGGPMVVNDKHGHTATVKMFDKAISMALAEV